MSSLSMVDFNRGKIEEILQRGDTAAHKALPVLIQLKTEYNPGSTAGNESATEQTAVSRESAVEETIIHDIHIQGNETLSFSFIYRLLGIKPGDVLDTDVITRKIMNLYALGYFQYIQYHVEPIFDNMVNLVFTVKERTLRRLRLGLRYDSQYKAVANISVKATNYLIPGIRFVNELQFAGLWRWYFKTYYPSRGLDLPIYPYVHVLYKDIPVEFTDGYGDKIAEYSDRSTTAGVGLGLLFSREMTAELEYQYEKMNIKTSIAPADPNLFPVWKDKLRKLKLSLIFDTLDDVLLPRYGVSANGVYEGSYQKFGTDFSYNLYHLDLDVYHTLFSRHTLRFHGFYGDGSSIPVYKFMCQSGPEHFAGMQYDQLRAGRLKVLRLDYRYQITESVFAKLMYNTAFDMELRDRSGAYTPHDVHGYGFGVKVLSLVGPIELIVSREMRICSVLPICRQ
ncbi:MAG: POTRA domain-containing protein [candidate division KSB1 bacterium]|nr:POTRA domain-containing protein [candidate division KSB1 bacterium]